MNTTRLPKGSRTGRAEPLNHLVREAANSTIVQRGIELHGFISGKRAQLRFVPRDIGRIAGIFRQLSANALW